MPFTCNCLFIKFGIFPIKFKGDMHDSFEHCVTMPT